MALQSYPVHPDRIGDIYVTGEPYQFMDGHSQRRDPNSGLPLWSVRVSLQDIDLNDFDGDISLRVASVDKPVIKPEDFVVLSGDTRVSAYQVGRGNDARATVSLRGEHTEVTAVSSTTIAGDYTRGLFVNWDNMPDLMVTRAGEARYRPGRRNGIYFNYEASRPYQSEGGSGVEAHVVEVPGALQTLQRMTRVSFEGLRVLPVRNVETNQARVQLVADSIRVLDTPAAPSWPTNGRNRKADTPEPVAAEG